MMSIFSPASSLMTPRTRAPIGPMHAPFGLTPGTVDRTAILVRCPASRATATISTEPSTSSGTSSANSLRTRLGCVRRERDLRAARPARDAHDVAAHPLAVHVALARAPARPAAARPRSRRRARPRPRRGRWPGRRAARRPATISPSLAGELAEGALVLGVPQPLDDHLAGGGGGDPAEALGRVVPLRAGLAVVGRARGPARARRRSCGRCRPARGAGGPRCAGTR